MDSQLRCVGGVQGRRRAGRIWRGNDAGENARKPQLPLVVVGTWRPLTSSTSGKNCIGAQPRMQLFGGTFRQSDQRLPRTIAVLHRFEGGPGGAVGQKETAVRRFVVQ